MSDDLWVVYKKDVDNGAISIIGHFQSRESATQYIRDDLMREEVECPEDYTDWLEDGSLEDTPENLHDYLEVVKKDLDDAMEGWVPGEVMIEKRYPATKSGKPARTVMIRRPKRLEFNWGIFTYVLAPSKLLA